jgi:hypothetical protein
LTLNRPTFTICEIQRNGRESSFMVRNFDLAILRHVNMASLLRFTNDPQIFFLVAFSKQLSNRRRPFYDFREGTPPFFARARPSVWPILK